MTHAALDVARKLAAHPRWEWRPRMAVRYVRDDGTLDDVVGTVEAVGVLVRVFWPDVGGREYTLHVARERLVFDLDDPATAGVVLGMLPPGRWTWEAYGGRHAVWNTDDVRPDRVSRGSTIGEAAGRALLAVWGQP